MNSNIHYPVVFEDTNELLYIAQAAGGLMPNTIFQKYVV